MKKKFKIVLSLLMILIMVSVQLPTAVLAKQVVKSASNVKEAQNNTKTSKKK